MISGPEEIIFAESQDTLLNSLHRDRGNNSRDLYLRQLQIMSHFQPYFVQGAVKGDIGLGSAT
jgi:hypothetical protein